MFRANCDLPLFSTVQKSEIFSPDLLIRVSTSEIDTITIRLVNFAVDSIMFVRIVSFE